MTQSERLGTEGMWKLIIRMTLPTIAAQIVNLLYNIVDKIYIGHIPDIGKTALTGVGVTTSIILIISAFSSFVGGGGAPLASIELGKGNKEKAEKILANGTSILLIFSILLTITIYIWKEPLLYFVGASDATIGYANEYLAWYLLGTIMVQITVGLTPFVIAQGDSKIAMISVIIGALLNIGLDPLFIFTFDMGVKGAAIATVISQFFSAIIILYYLIKKANIKIKFSYMKLEKTIVWSILSLGISPFVMTITESIIAIVMNRGLQQYGGDDHVGSLTIMTSVMQFIGVPLTGFTQGVTPIISYNFGAGNKERVKEAFKDSLIILFGFTSSFTLATMIFPEYFARIFSSNENLVAITTKAMPIFMAGMLVFGIQRACQTTFMALGQAKISLFIAVLRKIILLVPLAIILPNFFGVWGIYLAEAVADTTAAITCGIIFICTFPKILSKNSNQEI